MTEPAKKVVRRKKAIAPKPEVTKPEVAAAPATVVEKKPRKPRAPKPVEGKSMTIPEKKTLQRIKDEVAKAPFPFPMEKPTEGPKEASTPAVVEAPVAPPEEVKTEFVQETAKKTTKKWWQFWK